jgi:hypothetical protein
VFWLDERCSDRGFMSEQYSEQWLLLLLLLLLI